MRLTLIAISSAVCPLFASCSALDRHTDAAPWRDALTSFSSHSEQWAPTTLAAVATPLLLPFDHQNTSESTEDHIFNTSTKHGDETALLLGFAPVVWGGVEAFGGHDEFLETSSEAMLMTLAETYALKTVINRARPDGSAQDSFPSGHTSFAFAGATLLARRWQDEHDGSYLGYALYVPAAFVGISRLEGDRHWLSDITFGAALGMFTANLVYDAHYGDEHSPGLFGREGKGWYFSAMPLVTPEQAGVALTFAF